MTLVTINGQSYSIDKKLAEKLDNIKGGKLAKEDSDRVYVIDGRERSGKSVFALQLAAYIDPTIIEDEGGRELPRITFSPQETIQAIKNTRSSPEHTKVIISDESFRGLSASGNLSKINKQIKQILQEMGQNNVVLFLVTPSFFLLEIYASVLRSEALFHIAKSKKQHGRRQFILFNYAKKGELYRQGIRKGWNYRRVPSNFRGWFYNKYPGGKEFEERYRAKKRRSLGDMDDDEKVEKTSKWLVQRDKMIYYMSKCDNEEWSTQEKIAKWLYKAGIKVKNDFVSEIINKMKDKEAKEREFELRYGIKEKDDTEEYTSRRNFMEKIKN